MMDEHPDIADAKRLFGLRLRELRLLRGLSQEKLAWEAGLDRTFISSCERGLRNISLQNIYRLAAALNVAPAELLQKPSTNVANPA